ncbi:MAG: uracil-xanthine permease [Bacilli bacterium]|nr:uracil-xanthine permease [Bacilli bacterium]
MENKLIYNVEDTPKFSKMLVFAFQQVLAVLAATILVPTIIGLPVNIPSAILGAGLGTIVYLLFTKFKSPVVISSSFAFLTALSNALAFGYMGIALGALFAGLVYVIIAIIVNKVGAGWVKKLLPPVIIGPVVAIIGLSLAGNAAGNMVKAAGDSINGGYNLLGLLCALVTFFTVVICSVQGKSKTLKLIPFIVGIGAGYFLASIFSIFGYVFDLEYMQIIDWSPIVNNFDPITFTSFLDLPRMSLIEGIKELATGEISAEVLAANPAAQPLTWIGVAEVALAFIPVAFVVFAEHIADHTNLGTIINKDLLNEEPGLDRTLLGDGVGSIVGTFFGVCPNTTYGESVGCVAITKNASVKTIFTAAIMLIALSFLAPVTAVLRTIPDCVMGGVCLTLYGFIAVSGLKMFKEVDLNNSKNLFTVSAILIAGIGGLSIQIPYSIADNGAVAKVITITSVATALFLGILTLKVANVIEKHFSEKTDDAAEVTAIETEQPAAENAENK